MHGARVRDGRRTAPESRRSRHRLAALVGAVSVLAGTLAIVSATPAIALGTPRVTTTPSPGVILGDGTLTAMATVAGRVDPRPGATVDFRLYGPDDTSCAGSPVFQDLGVSYPVAGGPVTSAPFTPTAAGTYRWVASYSGDAGNGAVAGACEPIPAADQFVRTLFQDLLDRSPSARELTGFVAIAGTPEGRARAAGIVALSPERAGLLVDRAFGTALERPADPTGRRDWLATILSGRLTPTGVLARLYASDENFIQNGSDLGRWVDELYTDFVDRAADARGRADWVTIARTRGRLTVVEALLASPEARGVRVDRLYRTLLHREADPPGRAAFVSLLGAFDDRIVTALLAGSFEYFGIAQPPTVPLVTVSPRQTPGGGGGPFVPLPSADLSISKVDDVDPIVAGSTLTYTVQVDNAGPDTAQDVVVTDTLPAGVTFVSTTGCVEDPTGVPTCSLGAIAAGGSAQYTVEVGVDLGTTGTVTNDAAVTATTADPDTTDNQVSEDTVVTAPEADLSISKVDDVDPIVAGSTLTYTVQVDNAGPDTAQDVVVTDTLPAGVTFVSTTGCVEDPTGVPTCSLGALVSGGSTQYTVEVTVDAGTTGTITNSASVTSSTTDPNGANDSTTEDTTVNPPVPPNAAPVITQGATTALTTDEDTVGTVDLDATDGDGDPISWSISSQASDGTAAIPVGTGTSKTVTYTPDADFNGSDSFVVRAEDGNGGSDTITVEVTVDPVNDAPTLGSPGPYDSLGNVGISVPAPSGLLVGADDPDVGDTIGATDETVTSTNGATVDIDPDGSFTYDPAPGYTGSDTFDYEVCDDVAPAPACATGTVTVDVADPIWFIDAAAALSANAGTLADPFTDIASFNASADPGVGDRIFLRDPAADYTDGIVLKDSQYLLGDGATGTLATNFAITVPTHSRTLPTPTGTDPVLAPVAGFAITLGSGNAVRGLDIDSGGSGISGPAAGVVAIDQMDRLVTAGGPGLDISATGGTVALPSVTVTSPGDGIDIAGSGATYTFGALSLTTSGTGLRTSGNTVDVSGPASVSATGGPAVDITSTTGTMTFTSLASTGSSGRGIDLDAFVGTFSGGTTTVTNPAAGAPGIDIDNIAVGTSVAFGAVEVNARSTSGIDIDLSAGTFTFGATDIDNSAAAGGNGIDIRDSNGSFTFASTTIADARMLASGTYELQRGLPTNDGDGNGIYLRNITGSFRTDGGTISASQDNGVDIRTSRNITLSGVTIDQDFQGNSGVLGHDVLDLAVLGSTIREIDDVDAAPLVTDSGMRLTEIDGDLTITDSTISQSEGYAFANVSAGSANRAVELSSRSLGAPTSSGCTVENVDGICDLDVTITGSTFEQWDFQGLSLRHVGGSLDVDVQTSTFGSINGAAISTGPSQQSATGNAHGLRVGPGSGAGVGSTFTDVGIAVEAFSARHAAAGTNVVIRNNTVTGTISDAIRLLGLAADGGAPIGSSAVLRATVHGNTIAGVADRAPNFGGGSAFFVAAEDGTDVDVTLDGNTVTGGPNGGSNVQGAITTQNQRGGDLDLVLTNNTFGTLPGAVNGFAVGFFGHDNAPTTATAVRFGGNNWNDQTGGFGETVAFDGVSGTMDVEGYAGAPTDSTALRNHIATLDTGVAPGIGLTIFSGSVTGAPATVTAPTYPTTP